MPRTSPVALRDQPSDAADMVVSRFRRLTEREVRLLVLIVQDRLGCQELACVLGMTTGGLASARQRVRRKLAVPPYQDLEVFVRSMPRLGVILASDQHDGGAGTAGPESRRHKDVLRVTIEELQSVATRARRRSAALEALPCRDEDAEQRHDEAAMAARVAEIVEAAVAAVLNEARRPVLRGVCAGEWRSREF